MTTTPFDTLHITSSLSDSKGRAPGGGERALVLGGGGSTGHAWLIGVIAGLFDAGLDVTTADLTVGTSAGSTVAAQLAGASPPELFSATLAAGSQQRSSAAASGRKRGPGRTTVEHLERFRTIIDSAEDVVDMRRSMGAAALDRAAASDGTWQAQWRATVESRLPAQTWPARELLVTAVDARTGQAVVFDRHSGMDLVDAVAASCAGGGFAYRIGDDHYIDGGYRRGAENADLAAGYEKVLTLSPLGGRTLHPAHWGMQLAVQVDELRADGSRVETIFPDGSAEHLFGVNAMDLSLRPAAARAGHVQGRALAEAITDFWS